MSYNAKNYMEQGGDKWVIGGALEIKEGATVTGLPSAEVPKAANQADSVAEDVAALVTDFNGLLAKLKAAGIMRTIPCRPPPNRPLSCYPPTFTKAGMAAPAVSFPTTCRPAGRYGIRSTCFCASTGNGRCSL